MACGILFPRTVCPTVETQSLSHSTAGQVLSIFIISNIFVKNMLKNVVTHMRKEEHKLRKNGQPVKLNVVILLDNPLY